MDTTRFILIMALSFVLLMLWQEWEKDYGAKKPDIELSQVEKQKRAEDIPDLSLQKVTPEIETKPEEVNEGEKISVTTDVMRLEIDTKGGTISLVELLDYPVTLEEPDIPIRMLYDGPEDIYLVKGGLLSQMAAPTHEDTYIRQQQKYELKEGQDKLLVSMSWVSDSGIEVLKSFEFRRGSYLINVRYDVKNNSGNDWKGSAYGQIQRTNPETSRARMIYTYTGGIISTPENPYEKIGFDDMREEKLAVNSENGWIAMLQHYFVTALVPARPEEKYHYYTLALENERYAIGALAPQKNIASGTNERFEHKLYIGPKIQKDLKKIATNLELTVDYGVLWFIAKPLFWCLEKFYSLTGNWGWAIILVTLMLKILFYHLSAKGYLSMANMRKVQPRLLALRERYKNDRARLNQAMMDIYKKEKINPLGGCFPILVQIPVFIALYWVLLESVELRQAPFILWIKDLSGPDPYFVLPIVMGITMVVQQKLNPAPLDPVQEKIMMILPLVFTVFFAFFPAGLVLYWVVNNILSIAQQWLITRKIEKAAA